MAILNLLSSDSRDRNISTQFAQHKQLRLKANFTAEFPLIASRLILPIPRAAFPGSSTGEREREKRREVKQGIIKVERAKTALFMQANVSTGTGTSVLELKDRQTYRTIGRV